MSKWRSMMGDLPDWGDEGPAEFKRRDGAILKGVLEIVDQTPGPEEYPLFEFTLADGTKADIFQCDFWRPVGDSE
jgi:hypothetical protein